MPNRKRTKQIIIRCTEDELKLINAKIKESCLTKQGYILSMLIKGKVVKNDLLVIKDLSFELNKIGTNINQVVKICNARNDVTKTDVVALTKYMQLIIQLLKKQLKKETVI